MLEQCATELIHIERAPQFCNISMKYFIANWKSHKTQTDAEAWLTAFQKLLTSNSAVQNKLIDGQISIVLCPSYVFLAGLKHSFLNLPHYSLGVQNVSPFPPGSYTGEVSARMLAGLAEWTIVGHSERRTYFHETNNDVSKKLELAQDSGLKTILCIRGPKDMVGDPATLIAYEPVEAIGTGKNASSKDILAMRKELNIQERRPFIYGGSVDANNCKEYIQTEGIDGFLVGTAALDPAIFFSIVSSY